VQGENVTIGGAVQVAVDDAHIDAGVVFLPTSTIDFEPASTLHVNGEASYLGPTFSGFGTLQHNGTTLFTSATPLAPNRFVQNGSFTVIHPANGSRIAAFLTRFNPGSQTQLNSNLGLAGITEVLAGAVFAGNGTLVVETSGSLFGDGTIGVDVMNSGGMSAGFSPGLLTIDANFAQTATGRLDAELAGTMAGVDYDQLFVSGLASLDGLLAVSLVETYLPAAGNMFDLLLAETILGTFSNVMLPVLPASLAWDLRYVLDPSNTDVLRLSVRAVPLPPAVCLLGAALIILAGSRRRKIDKPTGRVNL
jgi:hypothetical protein